MTQGTRVGNLAAKRPTHGPRGRSSFLHRFAIAAIALIGLVCAGSAWADSLALMSGAGQSGLAGSASQQPLVVAVRDVNGAVVAGRTIDWSTSNGFTLSSASSVTDANGLASVNFTYGNSGTTTIVANDPVGATSTQADETSIGASSFTLISGNNQAGRSGTASTQPIVVQVLDASGVPIVGSTVNWVDQTQYTHVSAATSITDANGDASMNFTYLEGTTKGSGNVATIQATSAAVPSQPIIASMTVLGYDNLTILSGATQSGFSGSTSQPIVAQVTDSNGNPVAGVTVNWSQTQGPAGSVSLSNASTVTGANGKTSITFQYLQPNSGVITAQTSTTNQVTMNFTGTSAASLTLISPNGVSGPAGTVSRTPMVVQAIKPDGTPEVGGTIQWTTSFGTGAPLSPSSITDASGKASVNYTFGGATGSVIQARDAATGIIVSLQMTGAPVETIQVVSGNNQIGNIGTSPAQPLVVQVLSPAGAPVIGRTINWSNGGGNQFGLGSASSVTNANGQASITFSYGQQSGNGYIFANDSANKGVGVAFSETATGVYSVSQVSGNNQSGVVGTASAQPLVMQELDASGNPLVGRTINWSTTGNITLKAATSITQANGQAFMGYTYGPTASISQVSASDPLTVNTSGSVQFVVTTVGANAVNVISGNGQSGLINAPGAQPLVVEVLNAAGQPVSGRTINWARTSGDVVPGAPSSVTDSTGRTSITFTYGPTPSNPSTVAATDSVTGQKVQFSMTTGVLQNSARIVSGNGQSGQQGSASKQPIVVQVVNASNQPVVGQNEVWSVVSGSATLGTVTTTTDANGDVSANFNFGPTPGNNVIQLQQAGGPNAPLVQATEITLLIPPAQTLSIVSGTGQVLVANTPSQPLVVQLVNTSTGNPVAGATINWTATNGKLTSPSSVTDASGRASNIVTATTPAGAVTVQAASALASAPVAFNLSSGLVNIPGLTPPEIAVAGALDIACPALGVLNNPTPLQVDLLARCRDIATAAGIDPTAAAYALGQLVTETAGVQSAAAVNAETAQFQNITLRLNALRSSSNTNSLASNTSSLSGLSFSGPGGVVPVTSLMGALLGDGDKPADKQAGSDFSRWGFFATGNIGTGSADARSMTPGYNFDINGLTAGVDYRMRDNWISGVAVGYSRQNTDLQNDAGHVSMNGWSLSTYSTWSFKNDLYLDGVLTWGNNSFDLSRRIEYTLPTPDGGTTSINQLATSHPGGNLFMAALTFGGDFHKNAWNFSPYAQLISSRMGFDGYQEALPSGLGEGLGLAVDSRSITTFSSVLGTKISLTQSTSWGVLIPTASLEWQHEFNSDQNATTAHFVNDPTQTPFSLLGNPLENSFVRFGLGSSFVMAHGRSGFILYEHTFGQDGVRQDNLGVGIRIEF
jgi:uncharacterized protein with beta-barrel porin domain